MQIQGVHMPQVRPLEKNLEQMKQEEFKFQLLDELEEGKLQDKLKGLLSQITQQGTKLSKHMDISDMKQYRMLMSEFFYEVTANSHRFSKENYLDSRGRHRVYGIIRNVNGKVDEIAAELLKQETSNVTILNKIGEIHGLLLDIVT